MADLWKLHISRTAAWNRAGLMICHRRGVVTFGDLNPEVSFKHRLTRWERFKVGCWFLLQALQPESEE